MVLYEALGRIAPSPVVDLNRAVAIAMAQGPAGGSQIVDELVAAGALPGSHLLPGVRGELLARLDRTDEARVELAEALAAVRQRLGADRAGPQAGGVGPGLPPSLRARQDGSDGPDRARPHPRPGPPHRGAGPAARRLAPVRPGGAGAAPDPAAAGPDGRGRAERGPGGLEPAGVDVPAGGAARGPGRASSLEHDATCAPPSTSACSRPTWPTGPAVVRCARGRSSSRDWVRANDSARRDVLARLEAEGPLPSRRCRTPARCRGARAAGPTTAT